MRVCCQDASQAEEGKTDRPRPPLLSRIGAYIFEADLRVLCKEIGVVDTKCFVGRFTVGHGNYTAERDALFVDMTLDDMIAEIKRK